jgi:acetoin:2,6-dichlorophenolindophenol oxidoreductase subunit beta
MKDNKISYSENILKALDYKLSTDKKFFIIGQGLWSPWYVGNTMKGLEKKYGKKRIVDTPVSEAATTGLALGSSLHDSKVLILHPRMDFSILSFDQIINQIANWELMFGGQSLPDITIRLIINRGGEQGAQHSQALHSVLSHFPRLKIVMPYSAKDAKDLLIAAINYKGPVIYIDDRWLYENEISFKKNNNKIIKLKNIKPNYESKGNDLTIISFGFGVHIAKDVANNLKEKNFKVELIDLRIINPIDYLKIINSVKKTKKFIFIDIGYSTASIGSSVIAEIFKSINFYPKFKFFSLYDTPAPTNSYLEKLFYHSVDQITQDTLKEIFNIK